MITNGDHCTMGRKKYDFSLIKHPWDVVEEEVRSIAPPQDMEYMLWKPWCQIPDGTLRGPVKSMP